MTQQEYQVIENYMLSCMKDSAHDKEHIYRVLYVALDVAQYEKDVDYDILIASCLLHDIGRQEQFENPTLSHAIIGGQKAYDFLMQQGWKEQNAKQVKACIEAHSFRVGNTSVSIEGKILFDADKVDVTGAIGIARTLLYAGEISEPLYSLLPDGTVSDGSNASDGINDNTPSFFHEYRYKLESIHEKLYTERGRTIAKQRQVSAAAFYQSMLQEVRESYANGVGLLKELL